MKYLIGSHLLGLEKNKDIDYLVIADNCDYVHKFENGEDIFYRSEENLKRYFSFDVEFIQGYRILIYNYQYDQNIIGQNFPIHYNVLDYRGKLIEFLKFVVERKIFNFNKGITTEKLYCSKSIYHIAYNIFILQNNSPIITPEQKEIIQKIHDKKMPIEYLDELEKMLYELK